jgi:hypothetical protein
MYLRVISDSDVLMYFTERTYVLRYQLVALQQALDMVSRDKIAH